MDKMCLFFLCFSFDIPGSFRNSWCGIVFQLLVAFEEPKNKNGEILENQASQSSKFLRSFKTEPGTAPGVTTEVTPGVKSTKDRAETVSGGICSAVPFIPNGVEILKNIQETL